MRFKMFRRTKRENRCEDFGVAEFHDPQKWTLHELANFNETSLLCENCDNRCNHDTLLEEIALVGNCLTTEELEAFNVLPKIPTQSD